MCSTRSVNHQESPFYLVNVYNFVSSRVLSNVSSTYELLKMLIVAYWTVTVTVTVTKAVVAADSEHEPAGNE